MAIVAAEELGLNRVLVICPASVKVSWKREIEKWSSRPRTIQILEGKKSSIEDTEYTIVNYDLLSSKAVLLPLLSRSYDLLVCDEAHYIKNLSAKRTKCVYFPKALSSRAKRIWLLTGTPVLNRPIELYSHLKSLIPERLGPYQSYIRYAHRYCGAYEGKWGMDVSGATNLPELSNILSTFMLRREKKDVLKDLPEKTYQNIYLPKVGEIKKLSIMERREYEKEREGILGELASIRRKSGLLKVPGVLEHVRNILEEKEKEVG
jgi:SWI/SNF-related matrix-associated actin-dependent regulator 1 of chromatin subfamily A